MASWWLHSLHSSVLKIKKPPNYYQPLSTAATMWCLKYQSYFPFRQKGIWCRHLICSVMFFKHLLCNTDLTRDEVADVGQFCTPPYALMNPRSGKPLTPWPRTKPLPHHSSLDLRGQTTVQDWLRLSALVHDKNVNVFEIKNTSAEHRFTTRQYYFSPCHEKLSDLPQGKVANVVLLGPVPIPCCLDLSLPAACKYSMMWKENSRVIPLPKQKMECKLSALDH